MPIVSVSPFLVGWTGRLYVFSVDTDFLFFRRDRCKSLAWCLLHIFQYLVLTLVLGWYRWVHRRPKLNISRCINFSEHVLRYWVWEPVLSASSDYELRSPIIEHNKALQSTFLRTEIILAFCRKRSQEGSFFLNTSLSFSCGRTKYGGFWIRWCHASYSACPIRIRSAWASPAKIVWLVDARPRDIAKFKMAAIPPSFVYCGKKINCGLIWVANAYTEFFSIA